MLEKRGQGFDTEIGDTDIFYFSYNKVFILFYLARITDLNERYQCPEASPCSSRCQQMLGFHRAAVPDLEKRSTRFLG